MIHELSDHEAYELFRRAIVEGCQEAWEQLYCQYRAMVLGWAYKHGSKNSLGDSPEEIADHAFARAWSALRETEDFSQFHTTASLLAYLRSCVTAAVIDEARTAKARERMQHHLNIPFLETPEDQVLREVLCQEVWAVLAVQPLSAQERIVLNGTFVECLPPRDILRAYPALFTDVEDVYATKRNLFQRLKRCQSLQRLYSQLAA